MEALAERSFLRGLAAGCHTPVAGCARADAQALTLTGLVASLDGRTVIRSAVSGPVLGRGGARPEARRGAPRPGCGGAAGGQRGRSAMSFEVAVARPLAGRVILVTRAREQAAGFAALLEEAGGTVMLVPTIAIEPPDSWEPWTRRSLERPSTGGPCSPASTGSRWCAAASPSRGAAATSSPRAGSRRSGPRRPTPCGLGPAGRGGARGIRGREPRRPVAARDRARGSRPRGAGRRDARRARARAPGAGRRRRRGPGVSHARGAGAGRRPAAKPSPSGGSTS